MSYQAKRRRLGFARIMEFPAPVLLKFVYCSGRATFYDLMRRVFNYRYIIRERHFTELKKIAADLSIVHTSKRLILCTDLDIARDVSKVRGGSIMRLAELS